jgi:hypothetical protein
MFSTFNSPLGEESARMPKQMIPAIHAEVFFNRSEVTLPPEELVVVDRRTRFKGGVVDVKNLINGYDDYNCSLGAHCSGWMVDDDDPNSSPEGIFASNWIAMNPEKEAMKMALRQFAKIDECAWARTMLAAVERYEKLHAD